VLRRKERKVFATIQNAFLLRLSDGDRKCSARRIAEGEKVSRGGGNLGTCLAIRSHPLCMHINHLNWHTGLETGWHYSPFRKANHICDKCPFERMLLTGGTFSRFLERNQEPKKTSNYSLLCVLNGLHGTQPFSRSSWWLNCWETPGFIRGLCDLTAIMSLGKNKTLPPERARWYTDNIKMEIRDKGCGWMELIQDRVQWRLIPYRGCWANGNRHVKRYFAVYLTTPSIPVKKEPRMAGYSANDLNAVVA
jgi:hypothetical protein